MTAGVIFHGIGSFVRGTWPWAFDTSVCLVSGSGEGDRPWADRGNMSSSSISSNRLCEWIVSHENTPSKSHTHTLLFDTRFEASRSCGIDQKG
jgi:hypothetical protein